jgi:putative membrane protein
MPVSRKLVAAAVAGGLVLVPTAGHAADRRPSESGVSEKDKMFLEDATEGDLFEIAGGRLALSRGANPLVKEFGARMVTDHSKALADVTALAASLHVDVPDAPAPAQQQILRIWGLTIAGAFDCSYIPTEYIDHKLDVNEFKDEAEHGTNARVREFARASLPMLRAHRSLAEADLKALSSCS